MNRAVTARFLKGPFTLKIAGGGSGTGSGRVRSQTGLSPAINCTITSGTAAATGCSASYPAGNVVILTATASTGHTFAGWSTPCGGTGTCQLTMRNPRTIYAAFSPRGHNAAAIRGKWGTPFATNVLAVHAHLLPTGKVLFWGKQGEARLWNPADPSAGFADVTKAYQLYCTGHAFLPDGRLMIVGGAFRPHRRSWVMAEAPSSTPPPAASARPRQCWPRAGTTRRSPRCRAGRSWRCRAPTRTGTS